MPIVQAVDAPTFTLGQATFTGLAAPSRGARETCVWRTRAEPGGAGAEHWFDREEILVVLSGAAVARLGGVETRVEAGGAIIVPAGCRFAVTAEGGAAVEMLAVLPVGAKAHMVENGEPFVPPMAM
ncbi:cupin domain-containing protein [Streptomyces indicus]|uniref:Cupin domain-containing protein n=1 Tax=Streptomyces indicus TaxID=417292 RepID=A0A1G8ZQM5_9ACTN|nr:cupin domain-containing protein [Streptomyces indicus]SDK17399.1 Cupin domain-containing protein [Streptomyces indicus]